MKRRTSRIRFQRMDLKHNMTILKASPLHFDSIPEVWRSTKSERPLTSHLSIGPVWNAERMVRPSWGPNNSSTIIASVNRCG